MAERLGFVGLGNFGLPMARRLLGGGAGSPVPMTSLVAPMFRMVLAQGFEQGGLATPMRLYAQGPLKASDNGDRTP